MLVGKLIIWSGWATAATAATIRRSDGQSSPEPYRQYLRQASPWPLDGLEDNEKVISKVSSEVPGKDEEALARQLGTDGVCDGDCVVVQDDDPTEHGVNGQYATRKTLRRRQEPTGRELRKRTTPPENLGMQLHLQRTILANYDDLLKKGGTLTLMGTWTKRRTDAAREIERLLEEMDRIAQKLESARQNKLLLEQQIKGGGRRPQMKEWGERLEEYQADIETYERMLAGTQGAAKAPLGQPKDVDSSVTTGILDAEIKRLETRRLSHQKMLDEREFESPEQKLQRKATVADAKAKIKAYRGMLSDLRRRTTVLRNARRKGIQANIDQAEASVRETEGRIAETAQIIREQPPVQKGRPPKKQASGGSLVPVPKANMASTAPNVKPPTPMTPGGNALRELQAMRGGWDLLRSGAGTPEQMESWRIRRLAADKGIQEYRAIANDLKAATSRMELARQNDDAHAIQSAQNELDKISSRQRALEAEVARLGAWLREDRAQSDEVMKKKVMRAARAHSDEVMKTREDLRRRLQTVLEEVEELDCDITSLADEIAVCVGQRDALRAEADEITRQLATNESTEQRRTKQQGRGAGPNSFAKLLPGKDEVSSMLQGIPSQIQGARLQAGKPLKGAGPFVWGSGIQLPKNIEIFCPKPNRPLKRVYKEIDPDSFLDPCRPTPKRRRLQSPQYLPAPRPSSAPPWPTCSPRTRFPTDSGVDAWLFSISRPDVGQIHDCLLNSRPSSCPATVDVSVAAKRAPPLFARIRRLSTHASEFGPNGGPGPGAGSVTSGSGRPGPSHQMYRSTLYHNGIVLDYAGHELPEELRTFANTDILRQRESPQLDDEAVHKVIETVGDVADTTEASTARLIWTDMFPLHRPGLAEGWGNSWSTTAIPNNPEYLHDVSAPRPTAYFGYPTNPRYGWSLTRFNVITHPVARPYAQPAGGITFPFLMMEIKSEAEGGTLYVAENQAAGSGSHSVNALLWLLREEGKTKTSESDNNSLLTDTIAFTIAMTHRQAVFHLHWYSESDRRYYMSFLKSYSSVTPEDIRACNNTVKNIIDYGLGARRTAIATALEALFPFPEHWKQVRPASTVSSTPATSFDEEARPHKRRGG
ncbi:MAG: hypothetical protein M1823_003025 [Watsoniomyces obsoletus]|nr:MAG: hypothetical protein M1823_003025 [Watsoniomyces obsoletus]